MPKPNNAIKRLAKKRGLLLGGLLILLTFGAYSINWDIFLQAWLQITKFALVMLIAIVTTVQAKKLISGRFSFRDAFSTFFITAVLGLFLYTLFNWLLLGIINPQAGHYITGLTVDSLHNNLVTLQQQKETLQASGKDIKRISNSIKGIQVSIAGIKDSFPFSLLSQLKGFVTNIVFLCLPAIIVALILKTKKPLVL